MQANRELTNIVSPGFAPFEQYHSQGNQGPWTDIYSIGAVMYWMVTGKKPVESAARVKNDAMLPATALAESTVYGDALLRAIDWAMQPEEGRRPQSVGEFREALESPGLVDTGDKTRRLPPKGTGAPALGPSMPTASGSSSPTHRRNLLGTILFLDLVGYSIRSVDDQVAVKKLFNELIGKALRGVAEESRIAIDTGDGAAICFMGDPEEALHSALLLRDLLTQRYGTVLTARIGLHMGPVRVIQDINDRVNVIGDGINVAQRVMDFAQPNQVLVSRAYYDVISRITDDTAEMFRYLGQREDKHGRVHEVYSVESHQKTTTRREGPATGYTQTRPLDAEAQLDDAEVQEVESELARHIGPLAKVLVKKGRPLADSLQALRESLAVSIPDAKAREQFLAGPVSQPSSQSMPLSRPRSGPPSGPPSQPRSTSQPSRPGATQSVTRAAPVSGPSGRIDLGPDELAALELALGKFIGPMARIVVKKEMARSAGVKELLQALTGHIDQVAQRDDFLQAARKALPRRPL